MFAPKVTKPQTKAAESPISKLTPQHSMFVGQRLGHNPVDQMLSLQRTLGNQAMLRLLAQRTSNLTKNRPDSGREQEADPANLTSREAPRGPLWDFSKLPVFPPDRSTRVQVRPSLSAPPMHGVLQPKLTVGDINDPLEREADRIADHVMQMPDAAPSIIAAPPEISRKCAACEEEAQPLQSKIVRSSEAFVSGEPGIVQDVLRSPGQPFDATTRGYFEPRFGHDFSDVRVHTDAPAAASARKVNADAYTVGRDIVFDAGRFMPGTHEGRRLLAHELTHVVQQTGGTDGRNQKRHMPAHFPDAASAARPIPVQPAPGIGIARQPGHPPGTPLSAEELFQIIVTQRAFTFSRGGAPAVDPAGVGRGVGPQAGGRLAGQSVFAVVQIIDSNGNLVDIGYGEHTAFGAEHAEPRALRALEHSTAGRNVRGGRMLVVLDQFPCPPGRADCMGSLRNFARDRGLTVDIRVPQRPSVRNPAQIASPRSSARGVQRTDFPAVQLVPIEQAVPPAGDGGGAAPPGHGPGGGTPHGGTPTGPAPQKTLAGQSPKISTQARAIASADAQLRRAQALGTRLARYYQAWQLLQQGLAALDAIATAEDLIAHGTALPKEQADADGVAKESDQAVAEVDDTVAQISWLYWIGRISDAQKAQNQTGLDQIISDLIKIKVPMEQSARNLQGIADDLTQSSKRMREESQRQWKIGVTPQGESTLPNAVAAALWDATRRLSGTIAGAAENYAAAAETLRYEATALNELEDAADDAAKLIHFNRTKQAQHKIDLEQSRKKN
jgi:hypothetical protein